MKKLFKKTAIFLILAAFVVGLGVLWKMYKEREPDYKSILENSVLNNRHFSANVKEIQTKSGLHAYLMEDGVSPLVSISFKFLNSGLAYEDSKIGRVNFLADMLTEGTKSLSPEEYQEFLQQNGIKVAFSADYDDFDGQFTFPILNKEKALFVFKETLYNPRFGLAEMNLLKARYAVAFAGQKESERERFADITRPILYAEEPYSRNPLGDEEAIKNLTAADLAEFMKKHFSKDNLLISVAGAIDEKTAQDFIEMLFSALPNKGEKFYLDAPRHNFSAEKYEEYQDFTQNRVMIAAKGVYRNDKDFYPLYIANFIFGGSGLTSRLNEELRGKRGLTYGAYTGLSIRDKDALISGSFTTSADKYQEAVKVVLAEWKKFGQKGVKKDEFLKAKEYLIDSFNLRFDSTMGIAAMLTEIQKYNLGKDFLRNRNDYIRAITFDEVNAAAQKYFNEEFILIGAGKIDDE